MTMTIDEIKDMVIFCKAQRVKKMHVDGLEFEFSEVSFLEPTAKELSDYPFTSEDDLIPDPLEGEEDPDNILYHSAEG